MNRWEGRPSPFLLLDCVVVDNCILLFDVHSDVLDAPALCLLLQVVHIQVKPCVSVVHVVHLVVDEDLTVLVALGVDFDKSLHNLLPLFPVAAGVLIVIV